MADTSFSSLSPQVQDHLDHPRNTGPWPLALQHLEPSSGEAGSRTSGAYVRFHLVVEQDVIRGVRYEVLGTPQLIAAASWLSDYLVGRPSAAGSIPPGLEIARALALERPEHGMALLAEDAAVDALRATGVPGMPVPRT